MTVRYMLPNNVLLGAHTLCPVKSLTQFPDCRSHKRQVRSDEAVARYVQFWWNLTHCKNKTLRGEVSILHKPVSGNKFLEQAKKSEPEKNEMDEGEWRYYFPDPTDFRAFALLLASTDPVPGVGYLCTRNSLNPKSDQHQLLPTISPLNYTLRLWE